MPSTPEMQLLETALRFAELLAIVGAGGLTIFKLGRATSKFEAIGTQQAQEIKELKESVQELSKLTIANAVFDQKMQNNNDRVTRVEAQIEELRHGKGFIFPLESYIKPTDR